MKRSGQKKEAISCAGRTVSCFQMYPQTNTSCLELSDDDLTEINTISTGSLMGHKTHLIVGCHNASAHIGPRRDIHVMSAAALLRQLAVQDSDRPSWLTVSDSYPGRALPHQSSSTRTNWSDSGSTEWVVKHSTSDEIFSPGVKPLNAFTLIRSCVSDSSRCRVQGEL